MIDGLHSPLQVTPSQQAPLPSCQVTQAPPRWPPTLHTDQPIPVGFKWPSSGHHMLMKVNNLARHFLCSSLSLQSIIQRHKWCHSFMVFFSQPARVQCPEGSFFCFLLLSPVGSCFSSVSRLPALSQMCLSLILSSTAPLLCWYYNPSFAFYPSDAPLQLSCSTFPWRSSLTEPINMLSDTEWTYFKASVLFFRTEWFNLTSLLSSCDSLSHLI